MHLKCPCLEGGRAVNDERTKAYAVTQMAFTQHLLAVRLSINKNEQAGFVSPPHKDSRVLFEEPYHKKIRALTRGDLLLSNRALSSADPKP